MDCVLSSITKALGKGDSVSLIGFGTFKVAERKARKGRNPQTGEEIDIAASNPTIKSEIVPRHKKSAVTDYACNPARVPAGQILL